MADAPPERAPACTPACCPPLRAGFGPGTARGWRFRRRSGCRRGWEGLAWVVLGVYYSLRPLSSFYKPGLYSSRPLSSFSVLPIYSSRLLSSFWLLPIYSSRLLSSFHLRADDLSSSRRFSSCRAGATETERAGQAIRPDPGPPGDAAWTPSPMPEGARPAATPQRASARRGAGVVHRGCFVGHLIEWSLATFGGQAGRVVLAARLHTGVIPFAQAVSRDTAKRLTDPIAA